MLLYEKFQMGSLSLEKHPLASTHWKQSDWENFVKSQRSFFVCHQYLLGTQPKAEVAACCVFCTMGSWTAGKNDLSLSAFPNLGITQMHLKNQSSSQTTCKGGQNDRRSFPFNSIENVSRLCESKIFFKVLRGTV
jgi:hypothetical protein